MPLAAARHGLYSDAGSRSRMKGNSMPEPNTATPQNLLCFGDNLQFLSDRTLFPDACVDLIYLNRKFGEN